MMNWSDNKADTGPDRETLEVTQSAWMKLKLEMTK